MKKLLFSLIFAISSTAFTNISCTTNVTASEQTQDSVYICNSSSAYAYHSSRYCRGIERCSHGIIKVSLRDAVNKYGRRPCKICE